TSDRAAASDRATASDRAIGSELVGGSTRAAGFDHVALRAGGLPAMRARLAASGIAWHEQPVPGLPLLQMFVSDPCGARLELAFDLLDEAAAVAAAAPLHVHDANGTRTACRIIGSGPPLLLMHGGEADHSMFAALADRLAERFTVIAYDQRDCGATSNPPSPYSLADLADDAAALLDALGIPRCHVYGTSLGGQVAQTFACRHPARVGRLILGSTWRVGRGLADIAPATARELARLRGNPGVNAAEIASHFFPPLLLGLRPSLAAIFAGGGRSAEQRARRAAVLANPPDIDLRRIAAPTLLLLGGEDRLVPNAASAALADEIAGASIDVMPGIGHVAALQDPWTLAARIERFLSG
ncbi:MAG TPA: alpha/beta fold hydrolase, partial [Burkholderiaceae bacterium]|nr:alpha/beta fold hydrolase [Burkholderiaceae bacterium]